MHGPAQSSLSDAGPLVRALVAVGLTAIAGCAEPGRSTDAEVAVSMPPSDAEAAPPAGLESLMCVRLEVTASNLRTIDIGDADSEPMQGESPAALVREFLAEHLPHVDTSGSPDAWTLEVEARVQWEYDPQTSVSSRAPNRWVACRVRVWKSAVVDGRRVLAIAHEGPQHASNPLSPWPGATARERHTRAVEQTLEDALDRFVEQWFEANPEFTRQSGR